MLMVKTFVPDLIFMDNRLPYLKGSEVVGKILNEQKFKGKIVGISASVVGKDSDSLMKSGCDVVIQKPFKLQEIYKCLAELLVLEVENEVIEVNSENDQSFSEISKNIILPEDLINEMKGVAEVGDISGLEATLIKVEKFSDEGKQLAGLLKEKIEELDLDEISEILEEIPCQ